MKRRTFIQTSAVVGMGLPFLGCSSEMKKSIMGTKYLDTIGLQLWTVRDQLDKDFEGTIKQIAAHGYHQIETVSTEQADQAASLAKELGLKIFSSHIPSALFTGRWDLRGEQSAPYTFDELLESAEKKGFKHLIVAYLMDEERTIDGYKKLAEYMNIAGEKSAKAGITMGYHNHNFEFENIEGYFPFKILDSGFDPKYVQWELDVFWASIAGKDPVEMMKEMKGKIKLLHLKDKKEGAEDTVKLNVPEDAFKELGNGVVDIKKVVETAEEIGVEYCFVEQDQSPDPLTSTKTSIDWLKKTF